MMVIDSEAVELPPLEVPGDVARLLAANAPVAIGVSGGKDSDACAIAVSRFLRGTGHTGPIILIHSHLGIVEWTDSLPACQRLSEAIGVPLHVTGRKAGGMMERWEGRWANNTQRYYDLSCVKLILPWSTPSMRFCTSELKNDPISAYLKKTFGKQPIVSVTGIRAEESVNRAKMPASKANPKLPPGSLNWNPLLKWKLPQVFACIRSAGLELHEAYTVFGASRVSCAFCIMSAYDDLLAALKDERNHELYRRMCQLELVSSFAFQGGKWLSDLRPDLLRGGKGWTEHVIRIMKDRARQRQELEAQIPKHLEFEKGWPNVMPTHTEAVILGSIRKEISNLYGWELPYTSATPILNRYQELMDQKEAKQNAN